MIVMPAMSEAQTAAWHALMEIHERLSDGWTLVGGQMVHLHCAERGAVAPRPTEDADTVVDVRARPDMLERFTEVLMDLGFRPQGISAAGTQHRWRRDQAVLDVLIPEGVGERADSRAGVTGTPTVSSPGGTQALRRSESVAVAVDGREGRVRRPNLVGALVMKAAANTTPVSETAKGRHRQDFVVLASLLAAKDFRETPVTAKDARRLRNMIIKTRADSQAMLVIGRAADALDRLERASGL
jgi:hypothetical protein